MAVTYKYNGVDPFAGICAPPLLSRSEEIVRTGAKFVRNEEITLSGEIRKTRCNGGFEDTYSQSKALILKFAENFKSFEVIEDGITLYSHNSALVRSISFQESDYVDLIPFQIKITCFQDYYWDTYGIIDPKETFVFDDENAAIANITHSISAKGVTKTSDAIENARAFVAARAGLANIPLPYGYNAAASVLRRSSESINKLTGEVTLTENYIYDKYSQATVWLSGGSTILTYTSEYSEDDNGGIVSLTGKIQCSFATLSDLRDEWGYFDIVGLAQTEYMAFTSFSGILDLEAMPETMTVTENEDDGSISFTAAFRNNMQDDPFIVDTFTINNEFNGIDCISGEVVIRSIYGCPAQRLQKTKDYYATFDLDSWMAARWALYGTGGTLSQTIKSKSYSVNPLNGDIAISASYCTEDREDCGCLEKFNYTFGCSPAIPMFSESDAYHGAGCYYIQRLNCNRRAKFSINGSARPSKCCTNELVISQIYSRANQIMSQYFDATDIVLDGSSVEFTTDRAIVSFSFSWNGAQAQQLSEAYVLATF